MSCAAQRLVLQQVLAIESEQDMHVTAGQCVRAIFPPFLFAAHFKHAPVCFE